MFLYRTNRQTEDRVLSSKSSIKFPFKGKVFSAHYCCFFSFKLFTVSILTLKVVNHVVCLIGFTDFTNLTPASTRTRANHTKKLRQISSRSDAYKFSFFPRAIPVCNSLPATVVEAPDLVSFKQGLSTLTF